MWERRSFGSLTDVVGHDTLISLASGFLVQQRGGGSMTDGVFPVRARVFHAVLLRIPFVDEEHINREQACIAATIGFQEH